MVEVSQPADIPAGKICAVIDAAFRTPGGGLPLARRNVCGLDREYMAGTNLREEFSAFLESEECSELRRQAALAGCSLTFVLRDRHNPAAVEHAALRRLHRQSLGDV